MRRQAAPANRAGQAKLIERSGIVAVDARGQDLLLPGICRNFETLQLTHDFQQSALAGGLRLRRHMLPAQQPAHVLRRRDRLDLFAQGGDREVMNARQQPPLAPFAVVRIVARGVAGEVAAQDRSRSLPGAAAPARRRTAASPKQVRQRSDAVGPECIIQPLTMPAAHRSREVGARRQTRAARLRTAPRERSARTRWHALRQRSNAGRPSRRPHHAPAFQQLRRDNGIQPQHSDCLPAGDRAGLPADATSVCSASCNSSASRTSGRACFAHARDRLLVEPANFVQHRLRQHAPHLHGARAALFQRSVVEIGVRDSRSGSRAKTATAPAYRRRGSGCCRRECRSARAAGHRCPSPR